MWIWSQARRRKIEESREALRRTERLSPAIQHIADEGIEVATWARHTLEANGLVEIFVKGAKGMKRA